MGYKRKKRICESAFSSNELVENFLSAHPKGAGSNLVELWRHWSMIMGAELAQFAFPLGARGDVLLVGAEDNIILQELSFLIPEILERANAFMEAERFSKVELSLLQGRATLDAVLPRIDAENDVSYLPVHRPVSKPAPGPLGKLEIPPDSPLGKLYWKYVKRFGPKER